MFSSWNGMAGEHVKAFIYLFYPETKKEILFSGVDVDNTRGQRGMNFSLWPHTHTHTHKQR